jgi:hypothetical protein
VKRRLAVIVAALALFVPGAQAQIALPIYIEDNHAGSFYWLAEHLDLDQPVTLLHFDAHSDASGVFDSDVVRRQLRRVTSRAERRERLERWRKNGTMQCFAGLSPLMPSPLAEVIWVPRDALSAADNNSLGTEAGNLLDGHLEAAPRTEGQLRARFRVMASSSFGTSSWMESRSSRRSTSTTSPACPRRARRGIRARLELYRAAAEPPRDHDCDFTTVSRER